MTEVHTSIIEEEVAVLEAIYIHELEVERNERNEVTELVLQLHPSTGDNPDQQYVCMTLKLGIPGKYPDEPPNIQIKNPRGIGEEELQSTLEAMFTLCEERKGEAILYEIIELAKETLTEGNIPRCACMICLEHFVEGDLFCKTGCYHYFHDVCLGRYVKHVRVQEPEVSATHAKVEEKKLLCPVCREEISNSEESFPETPVEEKVIFIPSEDMIKQQAKMAAMLEKQRQCGGLIDVEAEKNKFLISTEDVVYLNPARRTPDISSSITLDNLEDPASEKYEPNKEGYKSDKGGSGSARKKGQGPTFEGRSHSGHDKRSNSKGKRENYDSSYCDAKYRNHFERDNYRHEAQRAKYRDDSQRGGRKTRRKQYGGSIASQRTDKYDDNVNERKTSGGYSKNSYSENGKQSSDKTKEDKIESSKYVVNPNASDCLSKDYDSIRGTHRGNADDIESSYSVAAKGVVDARLSGKKRDTEERNCNKYNKSFGGKKGEEGNSYCKDQSNYMYKTKNFKRDVNEDRTKESKPYSGRSYGRGRGRHNLQHKPGELNENSETRNFKTSSKQSDSKGSIADDQEKDFRMSEKDWTQKVDKGTFQRSSSPSCDKNTSDGCDRAMPGERGSNTQKDSVRECNGVEVTVKNKTKNTTEKLKDDVDGFSDKKSESRHGNERRYNKGRGRGRHFHRNEYSDDFNSGASDNLDRQQNKNDDRFKDRRNERRYDGDKKYNVSRTHEKYDKIKQEASEKSKKGGQNITLGDEKQKHDNIGEKLGELSIDKERDSAQSIATHNFNDDDTTVSVPSLSVSSRPSAPPGFNVKPPPGF